MQLVISFVFGALTLAAYPCTKAGTDAIAREGFTAVYERIQADALRRLKKKDMAIRNVLPFFEANGRIRLNLEFDAGVQLVPDTYLEPNEYGHELNYDTQVHPDFRGRGLNRLMVAFYLLNRPHIHRAGMSLLGTNQLAFLSSIVEGLNGRALLQRTRRMPDTGPAADRLLRSFSQLVAIFDTTDAVKAFRRKVIDAVVRDTAAGRIQSSIGMGKLTRVIIGVPSTELAPLDVHVDFVRGEFADSDRRKVEVFVADMGEHEFIRGYTLPYLKLIPSGLVQPGTEQFLQ